MAAARLGRRRDRQPLVSLSGRCLRQGACRRRGRRLPWSGDVGKPVQLFVVVPFYLAVVFGEMGQNRCTISGD
jgi:hypothetical protein